MSFLAQNDGENWSRNCFSNLSPFQPQRLNGLVGFEKKNIMALLFTVIFKTKMVISRYHSTYRRSCSWCDKIGNISHLRWNIFMFELFKFAALRPAFKTHSVTVLEFIGFCPYAFWWQFMGKKERNVDKERSSSNSNVIWNPFLST